MSHLKKKLSLNAGWYQPDESRLAAWLNFKSPSNYNRADPPSDLHCSSSSWGSYLQRMWAPLASHKASCWHSRGPSLLQTHHAAADGWSREDRPKNKDWEEDTEGQEETGKSKGKWLLLHFKIAQQLTRLRHCQMSSDPHPVWNVPKSLALTVISMHSWRRNVHLVTSSYCCVSPKLIFKGQWVNLGALGTNGVKSLQNGKTHFTQLSGRVMFICDGQAVIPAPWALQGFVEEKIANLLPKKR